MVYNNVYKLFKNVLGFKIKNRREISSYSAFYLLCVIGELSEYSLVKGMIKKIKAPNSDGHHED
jgi:hypothetical protein